MSERRDARPKPVRASISPASTVPTPPKTDMTELVVAFRLQLERPGDRLAPRRQRRSSTPRRRRGDDGGSRRPRDVEGLLGDEHEVRAPRRSGSSAIQPACRPMTSTTMTRSWLSAVVCKRSIASVAICTAVSNPNVTSVAPRSLSIVFGTPTAHTSASLPRRFAAPSVSSPPMTISASTPSRSSVAVMQAPDGRVVGRLQEFRAEREHDYYVVTEYHVGPAALIERLAVRHSRIHAPGPRHGYRVRWDQLDVEESRSSTPHLCHQRARTHRRATPFDEAPRVTKTYGKLRPSF